MEQIIALAQAPSLSSSYQLVHFNRVKERVKKELDRFFFYLESKNSLADHSKWIIFSGGYPAFSFSSFFPDAFLMDSSSCLKPPLSASLLHEYAIAIGAALDASSQDKQTVQFLEGKWAPKRQKENRKKWATQLATLCLALTLCVGLGGQVLLSKKKKALSDRLLSYLPCRLSNPIPQSIEEWEDSLWQWENSLKAKKISFPFWLTVPAVSDVLAWLSSHPALSCPDGGKKEGIDIKSFRYQLFKYPKLGDAGGIYAAKVDLELVATTPRLAREFHDALLKGDQIVNGKKEIKWNGEETVYWTSFELNPIKKEVR
jgi:type IV pilus assembly protein PilM